MANLVTMDFTTLLSLAHKNEKQSKPVGKLRNNLKKISQLAIVHYNFACLVMIEPFLSRKEDGIAVEELA